MSDHTPVALGMMRIAGLDDAALRRLVHSALDLGVRLFDHADIYGGEPHGCERRFGEAGAVAAGRRGAVELQSKTGIRAGFYDLSAAHIVSSVERSLAALRTDYLDTLLLHRPDALAEPEEVADAVDRLHAAGKIRAVGVSNHTPGQIELLRRCLRQPITVNQAQLSLTHSSMVAQGLTTNVADSPQAVDRDNGLLDYCRLHDIGVQAWSPFQSPATGRPFVGDLDAYPELNAALTRVAGVHGVSETAVAVAWIVRHPARMQVVLGTTNPERLADAVSGSALTLSREDWYGLYRAAGNVLP
ncbi:aldo/keto reductase [Pseudonocardia xishanensis]|uniref:Aldo/keto reductase n=1 Tax=Pseudonocardia xishanensis TaxID=630995 RepID=A0ABP8S1B4_9PSEU